MSGESVQTVLDNVARRSLSLRLKIHEAELARLAGVGRTDARTVDIRRHKAPFKALVPVTAQLEAESPAIATVFRLHYLEGKTFSEVQAILGVSKRSVFRCNDQLRVILERNPRALELLVRWGQGKDDYVRGIRKPDPRWLDSE